MAMAILQSDLYRNADDELRTAVDDSLRAAKGSTPPGPTAGESHDCQIVTAPTHRDAPFEPELIEIEKRIEAAIRALTSLHDDNWHEEFEAAVEAIMDDVAHLAVVHYAVAKEKEVRCSYLNK
jgi:hypothetical protein